MSIMTLMFLDYKRAMGLKIYFGYWEKTVCVCLNNSPCVSCRSSMIKFYLSKVHCYANSGIM